MQEPKASGIDNSPRRPLRTPRQDPWCSRLMLRVLRGRALPAAVCVALVLTATGQPARAAGELVVEAVRAIEAPRVFHPGVDDKAGYWEDFGLTAAFDLNLTTKRLAAVIRKTNGPTRLFVFDFDTGAITAQPVITTSYQTNVKAMKLSPDGRFAAVPMGREKQLVIWDVMAGTKVASATVDGEADNVDWHPSAPRLAVVAGNAVEVWRLDGAALVKERTIRGGRTAGEWPMSAAWSPDGHYLAIGTNSPAVYIAKADGSMQSPSLRPMSKGAIYMTEWSPAGDRLAVAGFGSGSEISVWSNPKSAVDMPSAPSYERLRTFTPPAGKGWRKLSWDPTGERLVFGDENNNAGIWNAATGAALETFTPHPRSKTIEAHWKGEFLVTVGAFPDKSFRIWRVTNTGQR